MAAVLADPLAMSRLTRFPLSGWQAPSVCLTMGTMGLRPVEGVDWKAGVDGVFLQVPRLRQAEVFQDLTQTLLAQRSAMGAGHVMLACWDGPTLAVMGVFETAHANVGLMSLEQVAMQHGLMPDAYVIGVSREAMRQLASPDVQAQVLTPD